MEKNVGKADKIVRIVLGLAIISIGIYFQSWWGAVGGGVVIPAVMSSDPLYQAFGINTNKN